jgi:hypothetical protein
MDINMGKERPDLKVSGLPRAREILKEGVWRTEREEVVKHPLG